MTHQGEHVRYVPSAFASELVRIGSATPQNSSGKVREIQLACPISSYGEQIGPPTGDPFGVRFTRVVRLDDSASRIVEHHPRSLYRMDDD